MFLTELYIHGYLTIFEHEHICSEMWSLRGMKGLRLSGIFDLIVYFSNSSYSH